MRGNAHSPKQAHLCYQKHLPFQRLQILQFCRKLKGQPEKEIDESDKNFNKNKAHN